MKYPKFTLILSALMCALGAQASPLTPEQALANALSGDRFRSRSLNADARFVHCWSGERNAVYAFNRTDGGFVIAAGDDAIPVALFGYSDTGSFDPNNIPPALEQMLAQFAEGRIAAAHASRAARADVAPLTESLWDQNDPYNRDCPKIENQITMTGCTATAAAQIMYHWKYPQVGKGSGIAFYGVNHVTFDYPSHPLDWENMIPEYKRNKFGLAQFTQDQANAVSNLMHAVGCACRMDYGVTASAASEFSMGQGLVNNFSYDASLTLQWRAFYELEDWNTLLYNELAAGRPMLYVGFSKMGGHAFVCDGYQGAEGDYFHINWGWSGLSNGYFLVTGLEPDLQGIGGSVGSFDYDQRVVMGIRPDEGGKLVPVFHNYGKFHPEVLSYARKRNVSFKGGEGREDGIFNYSIDKYSCELGVRLVETTTGEVAYVGTGYDDEFDVKQGLSGFAIPGSAFPASGEWKVTPAIRSMADGEWHDVKLEIDKNPDPLYLTATESDLTFSSESSASGAGVISADPAGRAEYFNLQGERVADPGHGVFIKIAGGKASKIIL